MIINHYQLTKLSLKITIRLLQNKYHDGWKEVNFKLTKDGIIQLTDDGGSEVGTFMFGYADYEKLVGVLGTEDVDVLTNDVYLRLTDKETYLYKYKMLKQLNGLVGHTHGLDHMYLGDTKYTNVPEAISRYTPEWDMELVFEDELKLIIRYRGESVVLQWWSGTKVVNEDEYKVNGSSVSGLSLVEDYLKVVTKLGESK